MANKTKKSNKRNLDHLWTMFDSELNKQPSLECLYSQANIEEKRKCDLCHSLLYISEEKLFVCSNTKCGVIYKDRIENSAEWRYYGVNDSKMSNPCRCGMPINPLLKEASYGCKVICRYNTTYEMRKIARYTEWQSMPYKEKAQYDEFERIKLMASNASMPKIIVDEALRYHKKISEQRTFRGLNRNGIIAASIYIGSRIHNFPRTAKEIASIFNLDNASATKGCKNAIYILNKIEKNYNNNDKTYFHATKPIAFIDRYCSGLNINKELTMLSRFIAERIDSNHLMCENTPNSVAAGIIYFISDVFNLYISKKEVKKVSEISEVTINKCHRKLLKFKELLIPSCILKKYNTNK